MTDPVALAESYSKSIEEFTVLLKDLQKKTIFEHLAPYLIPLVIGVFTFFGSYQGVKYKIEDILKTQVIYSKDISKLKDEEVDLSLKSVLITNKVNSIDSRIEKIETCVEDIKIFMIKYENRGE